MTESDTKTKAGSKGAASDPKDKRYRNPTWLYIQYHIENKTLREMADMCDVTNGCIHRWMDKHGIQRKDANVKRVSRNPRGFHTDRDGYELINVHSGKSAIHHRLIMASEIGLEALSDEAVYHKNGIPWDNRLENLTLDWSKTLSSANTHTDN